MLHSLRGLKRGAHVELLRSRGALPPLGTYLRFQKAAHRQHLVASGTPDKMCVQVNRHFELPS